MPELILKNVTAVLAFAEFMFLMNVPLKRSLSNKSTDKL